MPFVRICVTGDEERPTPEQKRELISGVTKLVGDVLGKNTSNMVVIIDEIPMENYGIGGKTDSVLLHPISRITLSSSERVQAAQSPPG